MRLWHVKLMPHLPRQQLLGQHRECCALRGQGWGRKHATVDYVFKHPYVCLFSYHEHVMAEMYLRGYKMTPAWWQQIYRGQVIGEDWSPFTSGYGYRYPEHNAAYLAECISNLAGKGVIIQM